MLFIHIEVLHSQNCSENENQNMTKKRRYKDEHRLR